MSWTLTIENRSARLSDYLSKVTVGLGATALAVLVRLPLEPILQGRNTFVVLEPAIAVAAWYGGFVSGGSATLSALLVSLLLYLEPGGLAVNSNGDFVSLILFAVNGTILTFLSSGLRSSYDRATRARVQAETSAARNDGLQRLALALNRPLSPAQVAQTAIDTAVRLLGANGGLVATGKATSSHLVILAVNGFVGDVVPNAIAPNDPDGPLGEVVRSREPTVFHGRDQRVARYPTLADKFESDGDSIVLPLLYQDQATGAVYLNFAGRTAFGPADRDYLCSIGAQAGSALARALLIEHADATAAKEQARAAELRTVLEAIGDGLLVGDSEGRVTLANTAAEKLLGKLPAKLSELSDERDGPMEPTNDMGRYLVRSPVRARDWLEITTFAGAGSRNSEVVLVRDVTASVEADLQRDAFLGVLSHELRTPITTIMVGVDLLRRSDGVRGNEIAQSLVSDIDADATRLNRIVADLLVLTRSERGALDTSGEPVLVHRVVSEVVERELQAWPDADIRITVADEMAPVEAEPTYVQQIVRNLLSNALKYGRAPGKPIEVKVGRRSDSIEVRVLDRGVGFAPGEAERLFTLFYRNPKVVSAAPGAGIGLYVCRLLAEAMRGSAWAKPRPGGGAEFGFSLPLMDGARGSHEADQARLRGAIAL